MASRQIHRRICAGVEIHIMINHFLAATWTRNGMEYPNLNCWGLVRLVRHEMYGLPLLPAFGIDSDDKRGMTFAANAVTTENLIEGPPCKGSIIEVWIGRLCIHVAVVIEVEGRLAVMESTGKKNVSWMRLPDFEAQYATVKYFNDKNLS